MERGAEDDGLEASGKSRNQAQGLDAGYQSRRQAAQQKRMSAGPPTGNQATQPPTGNQRLMSARPPAQNLESVRTPDTSISSGALGSW